MTSRKKNNTNEAASVAQQMTTDNSEQFETKEPRYVVIREGHRVSSQEYASPDDPFAIAEKELWTTISKVWSWGEPVNIVKYDNKLHRIYNDK